MAEVGVIVEFAISTKWMSKRASSPGEVIRLAQSVGLRAIELGCDTPEAWLLEYERAVSSGELVISSVHNYCPAPTDRKPDGDSYLLSNLDPLLRSEAVDKTKTTMRNAARLESKVVVLHLGRVEIDEVTAPLKRLIESGVEDDSFITDEVNRSLSSREEHARPHLDAVIKSIEELIPLADELNLILGLECRLRHRQIPLPHELTEIFTRFPNAPLGYWHDIGHAIFLDRLGFLGTSGHIAFLEAVGDSLVGFHIHDINGLEDHLAPGNGTADFRPLVPYLRRPNVLRVLEISSKESTDDVVRGIEALELII